MRPNYPIRLILAAVLVLSYAVTSFARQAQPTAAEQEQKLIAVLKSDASRKEKSDACRELARIGTKDAVAPLAALLADEDHRVAEAYGAWGEKKMYGKAYMGIIRKTFIIGKDGRIEHAIHKVSPEGHGEEIVNLLK